MPASRTYQTAIIASGNVATVALTIVMAAILSRVLEKEEYGTFRQILYIYSTLAVVFEIGLPKAVSYFLPRVSLEAGKATLYKIVWSLFANGLLFSFVLYVGSDLIGKLLVNTALPPLLVVYAPIPTLLLPTLALQGTCLNFSCAGTFAVFQIVSKLGVLLAVGGPLLLGHPLVVALRMWVIVSGLILIVAIWLMFRPYRIRAAWVGGPSIVDIFRFSLPLLVTSVLATCLASADRFIVSRCFGPEVFATYINGAMELPLIPIMTGATTAVLLPTFSRLTAGDCLPAEVKDIWSRATVKSALILYPCAAFAFFHADDVMRLLYSERYVDATPVFRIYLVLALVRVVGYAPLMLAIGSLRTYVAGHVIGCAVACAGSWCLCAWLRAPAWAAVSYVVSIYVMVGVFSVGISRRMNMPIAKSLPMSSLCAVLLISLLGTGIGRFATQQLTGISPGDVLVRVCSSAAISTVLYCGLSRLIGYDPISLVMPFYRRCRPD